MTSEEIKAFLVANNDLTMALVRTLVEIGNKGDDSPITTKTIKDLLFKNLT